MKICKHRRLLHTGSLILQLLLIIGCQHALTAAVPTYLTLTGKVVFAVAFAGPPLLADAGYLAVLALLSLALGRLAMTMKERFDAYAPLVAELLVILEVWTALFSWALVGYMLSVSGIAAIFTVVNVIAIGAVVVAGVRWLQHTKLMR
ncbi:hypothetical protein ACFQ5J_05775 [Lacticaseibacillus baoqingensis]|uniref:DUF3021 family protein n=1 Tax=Lacticaseibacillus baoqingensis TaxID=2486013 RepID=A0ABW4E4B2_9LACO|nr:hypothetical protein [Lacticaseibacillus baoqingensis]